MKFKIALCKHKEGEKVTIIVLHQDVRLYNFCEDRILEKAFIYGTKKLYTSSMIEVRDESTLFLKGYTKNNYFHIYASHKFGSSITSYVEDWKPTFEALAASRQLTVNPEYEGKTVNDDNEKAEQYLQDHMEEYSTVEYIIV